MYEMTKNQLLFFKEVLGLYLGDLINSNLSLKCYFPHFHINLIGKTKNTKEKEKK